MLPIVWVFRVILSYCQQLCTLLAGLQLSTRWISLRSWSRCQEWCIKSNQHSLKIHGPIKMLVLKRRTIWSNVSAARHISALKVEKKLTLSAWDLNKQCQKKSGIGKMLKSGFIRIICIMCSICHPLQLYRPFENWPQSTFPPTHLCKVLMYRC